VDRFLLYRTYDELEVGQSQRTGAHHHRGDIVNWCALTGDWFYPHIDKVARASMFGQRVAPGSWCLPSHGSGRSRRRDHISPTTVPTAALHGATWINDTIYLDIEVLEKSDKDARSRARDLSLDLTERRHRLRDQLKILTAKERAAYPESDGERAVLLTVEDGVAELVLNRPAKMNG